LISIKERVVDKLLNRSTVEAYGKKFKVYDNETIIFNTIKDKLTHVEKIKQNGKKL